MAGPRRRPALLVLGAALLLGLAGRVALGVLRMGPALPHGGALAGEAYALSGQWTGRAASLVLALELAAAAALVVLAARRRRAALPLVLALAAVTALGVAVAEDAVRDALRLAGWSGP